MQKAKLAIGVGLQSSGSWRRRMVDQAAEGAHYLSSEVFLRMFCTYGHINMQHAPALPMQVLNMGKTFFWTRIHRKARPGSIFIMQILLHLASQVPQDARKIGEGEQHSLWIISRRNIETRE